MIIPNANSIENNRVLNERLFIISTRMSAGSHYRLIHYTIEQYLQSMNYGSGSSNCYFRFYQQNILGS